MLDCALISSDEAFRHLVLGLVRQPAAQARLVVDLQISADSLDPKGVSQVLDPNPRVVFLDLGESPGDLAALKSLSIEAPDVGFVVTGPRLSAEGLLAVMRAGATEYLPRPLSREETLEAFRRVRRRAKPHQAQVASISGKVVTLLSGKGGTGVTTVATNLSVSLAQMTEKEVLLLDLAPSLGTAAVAMGLQPRYTYLDVIQNFHRIDEDLLRSFMETHESGVSVLASPLEPNLSEGTTPDHVQELIRLCKRFFGYVVIDAGNSLSPTVDAALAESDEQLLLVTPEIPSLRNLKRTLDFLARANGQASPHVVLNKYRDGLALSSRDVEDGIRRAVTAILEKDDNAVSESINLGRPAVLVGKSRFSKGLLSLSGKIAGSDKKTVERTSLLGRFRRSKSTTNASGEKS